MKNIVGISYPGNKKQLIEDIIVSWHHVITKKELKTIFSSMKHRCEAVMKNNLTTAVCNASGVKQSSLEDGRSDVFTDESRSCPGASDGHVWVRRRPGETLQLNCLRLRHTEPTLEVMVAEAISSTEKMRDMPGDRDSQSGLYGPIVVYDKLQAGQRQQKSFDGPGVENGGL
ncbi:hypothetical protein TNCV_4793881 [Trichonephila clavipes]|nr:hypothetical protein TNCV_4793881 [Trichonephila clavipes]